MSDTSGIDPDLTPEAPDEHAPTSFESEPGSKVTHRDDVDPGDGTDKDDKPVDNPAG